MHIFIITTTLCGSPCAFDSSSHDVTGKWTRVPRKALAAAGASVVGTSTRRAATSVLSAAALRLRSLCCHCRQRCSCGGGGPAFLRHESPAAYQACKEADEAAAVSPSRLRETGYLRPARRERSEVLPLAPLPRNGRQQREEMQGAWVRRARLRMTPPAAPGAAPAFTSRALSCDAALLRHRAGALRVLGTA